MPLKFIIPPATSTQWQCPACDSKKLTVWYDDWRGLSQIQMTSGNLYRVMWGIGVEIHISDDTAMRCPECGYQAEAHLFEWQSGPEGTIPIRAEQAYFQVGDIVSHVSGRICNGRYGQIILDWNQELMVLDNEGAPDIPVKNHQSELTVVGHVSTHSHLLAEFVFFPPGSILIWNELPLTKTQEISRLYA